MPTVLFKQRHHWQRSHRLILVEREKTSGHPHTHHNFFIMMNANHHLLFLHLLLLLLLLIVTMMALMATAAPAAMGKCVSVSGKICIRVANLTNLRLASEILENLFSSWPFLSLGLFNVWRFIE